MQGNIVLGIFGLDVIDPPAHKAALNEELILLKIEVVPLKRREFAHAKTETLGDLDHRAIRLTQSRDDKFELLHSQDDGTLPPLASALDTNERDGVRLSVKSSQRVAHSYIRYITLRIWVFDFGAIGRFFSQSSTAIERMRSSRWSLQRGLR